MDLLRKKGYFCIRSAGSKGPVDIVAIKGAIAYGIQCKLRGNFSKGEIQTLMDLEEKFGIVTCLAFREGKRIRVVRLSGEDLIS